MKERQGIEDKRRGYPQMAFHALIGQEKKNEIGRDGHFTSIATAWSTTGHLRL